MTQEALKLALEAHKRNERHSKVAETRYWCDQYKLLAQQAIEALAQTQEPVAWKHPDKNMVFWEDTKEVDEYHGFKPTIPLYPYPQRTWVGLKDDEMENTFIQCGGKWNGDFWKIEDADFHPFLRTIEVKLKQKNGYTEEKNT